MNLRTKGCLICREVGNEDVCRHTEDEIKQAEIEEAWSDHEWEDPSAERVLKENAEYDKERGAWHRIYREDT